MKLNQQNSFDLFILFSPWFWRRCKTCFWFSLNLRASATWWSSVWTSYGVRYETVTRIMRDGCSITKISEMDHSKQTEISWNWLSKKEKSISQEWKHISLICEKHLKAYLILLRYNNNFTIYQVLLQHVVLPKLYFGLNLSFGFLKWQLVAASEHVTWYIVGKFT